MSDGRRNNGGNPTNGGRKSARDERLRELVVAKAIGKVLKTLRDMEGMNDKEYTRIKEMCLPIVTKDMANKMANADGSNIEQVLVKFIDENNKDTS